MKNLKKRPAWVRIVAALVLAVALIGLLFRKPLLVAYHHEAMVSIWQTELGVAPRKGLLASVRGFFSGATKEGNPQDAVKAFPHREALLKLGYFTNRTFALMPVRLGTPDFQQLFNRVVEQTGQQPIVQFVYDQPAAPSNVVGLMVYATAADMPQWERFVTNLSAKSK